MAGKISEAGGVIKLESPVASVHPVNPENPRHYLTMPDGSQVTYDHIISTMPITHLVERLGAPEDVGNHAKALKFRNTILVYLRVEGDSPFPDQWIYVHSASLQTGRITNFRNWLPTINRGQADTILCLEYWCYDRDPNWTTDKNELVKLATKEIYQTGLITKNSVKDGHVVRVPRCYPVYASGYKRHLKPVEEFLSRQEGLSVIGRYGAFKYNNQDHSMLTAILAVRNILQGEKHDVWEVNTERSYHEEVQLKPEVVRKDPPVDILAA